MQRKIDTIPDSLAAEKLTEMLVVTYPQSQPSYRSLVNSDEYDIWCDDAITPFETIEVYARGFIDGWLMANEQQEGVSEWR